MLITNKASIMDFSISIIRMKYSIHYISEGIKDFRKNKRRIVEMTKKHKTKSSKNEKNG